MKKTFPFHVTGNDDQRVIEAIKNDVRKYVKRERRKALPEGVDFWDFNCKVGRDLEMPENKLLPEVSDAIDEAAKAVGATVYVEILATPGHRVPRIPAIAPASTRADSGAVEPTP